MDQTAKSELLESLLRFTNTQPSNRVLVKIVALRDMLVQEDMLDELRLDQSRGTPAQRSAA